MWRPTATKAITPAARTTAIRGVATASTMALAVPLPTLARAVIARSFAQRSTARINLWSSFRPLAVSSRRDGGSANVRAARKEEVRMGVMTLNIDVGKLSSALADQHLQPGLALPPHPARVDTDEQWGAAQERG